MLEQYFLRPTTVDRVRSNWLAPQIEQYVHTGARRSRSGCVQVVYKKAGLKGLKMDLSNAESTTDS